MSMMPGDDRLRVIFHGAVVLLVGVLCGLPAVVELIGGSLELWRAAHVGLLMSGVWLLAMASVLPSLVLERREAVGLVWSLLAMGYGLMTGLLIGAMIGVRAIQPTRSVAGMVAFVGTIIGVLGAVMATSLTLMGAHAARKAGRSA